MSHISDAELMMLADNELPEDRSAEVRRHVKDCWHCLARQAELQGGLAEFLQARAGAFDAQLSAIDGPAALLRARMKVVRPERPQLPWSRLALVAAVAVAGFWWLQWDIEHPLKPDSRLTPGATMAMSREEVCAVPDADEMRLVPASMAGQVFNDYGIRPTPRTYEVDYLIAPALGGATDPKNLWPQPYAAGVWNAGVKDALESHLRELVCQGAIDLSTAQQEIATDWIAAYRKYFRTDKPLSAHASFRKDLPWE